MNVSWRIALAGVVAAVAVASPSRADDLFEKIKYLSIRSMLSEQNNHRPTLGISKEGLCFIHYPSGRETPGDDRELPAAPEGGLLEFERLKRDGTMLRLSVSDDEKKHEVLRDHDGWYLSADYKTDPPRVILTKEPTKSSHWTFIRDRHDNGGLRHDYFIKNENDLNKDAWLAMEKDVTRYKRGWAIQKPILSFSDRQSFNVEDYHDGR